MTYEVEAVISIEISLLNIRVADFSPSNNDIQIAGKLNSLEERRDMASVRLADYQQKLAWGYNRNV